MMASTSTKSTKPGTDGSDSWSQMKNTYDERGGIQTLKDTMTFDALFKRYELAKAFSLNQDQVRKDAKRIKKRLMDSNRFLLNPDSQTMQSWDIITILALVFTLLVSPFEIGYLDGFHGMGATILMWINHTVSLTFAIDMVMNFFRPYRDLLGQKVKSHGRIAVNYLKTWFTVDIMSTIPFDTIADIFIPAGAAPSPTLKMIRLLRLLKLFRIVRASRVFTRLADRIEHHVSISHSNRSLLKWTILLITVVHWFICVWGLAAQLQGSQRTPELTDLVAADEECSMSGSCLPNDALNSIQCTHPCLTSCELRLKAQMMGWSHELVFNQENWVCRAEARGKVMPTAPQAIMYKDQARIYRYMSIAHLFGQLPPSNLVEYIVAYILAFCWLMMQNAFIGILCGTIADGDRHAKEYKQRMDELNYFLRDMKAPRDLAVRAREHCRSTRGLFKKLEYVKLFNIMSPMLRGDLAQIMSLRTLENVWYFQSCESDLLRALSEKLRPDGFARAERIYYEERINIVTKGAAARGGKILTLDCYWGEDMIITSDALKDTRYASALTYLELTTISRSDLEDCLVRYPRSERVIRVTALKMAMQRAGQIISHHLHTRQKAKELSNTLASLDPGFTASPASLKTGSKTEDEKILREMMGLVNGGKKLRVFDRKLGQIVDGDETVIDEDYVKTIRDAHRMTTDEHLMKVQEELAEMRLEQQKGLEAERAQMAHEKAAGAAERKVYMKLLGSGLKHVEATRVIAESKSTKDRTRPASRAETATPQDREKEVERAGREALSSGLAEEGLHYEKRFRRRKKDSSSPQRGGSPSRGRGDRDRDSGGRGDGGGRGDSYGRGGGVFDA